MKALTFCANGHILFVTNKRDGDFPDAVAVAILNVNESTMGNNTNTMIISLLFNQNIMFFVA